jgi:hypothetical protein
MSTSLVYRSATGYELVMRLLYGRHYSDRMRAVAEQVPDGASVVELCCGPATLYDRYLRHRTGSYIGIDVNTRFVSALRSRGIDARVVDLARSDQPLPPADAALIQASLYHFLPDAGRIVDLMLAAARDRVIVSEPVRNLASSRIPVLSALGRHGTDAGAGEAANRFTEETLDQLMDSYRGRIKNAFLIPGGREKVYVLAA